MTPLDGEVNRTPRAGRPLGRLTRRRALALAGGAALTGLAVHPAPEADAQAPASDGRQHPRASVFELGSFRVAVRAGARPRLEVRHRDEPDRVIWAGGGRGGFLQGGTARTLIEENTTPASGFTISDGDLVRYGRQTIDTTSLSPAGLVLGGRLRTTSGRGVGYTMTFASVSERRLRFHITLEPTTTGPANRIFLRYATDPDESFWGFGAQMTYLDQKGRVLPILVQEHGVGRGLPVITELVTKVDGPRTAGSPVTTEICVPHYVTSRARSFFVENTEYSVFDLTDPDLVELEAFTTDLAGQIVYGRTPLELVETFTEYSGRMRALPDWVHDGAIVCAQGGTAKVDGLVTTLADAGVPVSALWVQDWAGVQVTNLGRQVQWNWHLDPSQYPGWDQLQQTMRDRLGARTVLYVNPFLTYDKDHRDLFDEARRRGFLVRQRDGSFYPIQNAFPAALVDLSNPAAFAWLKKVIRDNLVAHGAVGWMADFGEALPFNARLHDRADPAVWHNRYPEEWSRLNREVLDETPALTADGLFFNRSGHTRSPAYATLFWVGDQLQTWDAFDGLRSAITGCIGAGFSGFSLTHSDIGGFDSLSTTYPKTDIQITLVHRSQELLLRWAEHSAFTCVMRTHQGIDPAVAWQVDEDADTLALFRRSVQLYQAWAFYRRTLVAEAASTGRPVIRAMALHYPHDKKAAGQQFQYLLGDAVLVAPVTEPGRRSADAYLPAGSWEHVWSGTRFRGSAGRTVTVAATLGDPPVFLRTDAADYSRLRDQLRAVPSV